MPGAFAGAATPKFGMALAVRPRSRPGCLHRRCIGCAATPRSGFRGPGRCAKAVVLLSVHGVHAMDRSVRELLFVRVAYKSFVSWVVIISASRSSERCRRCRRASAVIPSEEAIAAASPRENANCPVST